MKSIAIDLVSLALKFRRLLASLVRTLTRPCLGAAAISAGITFADEKQAAHMNEIPEFAAGNWAALPRLSPEVATVFEAVENTAGYNMHPALAYFDGRWWAMWSSGAWGEDMPGQKVRFAHSADGIRWSEAMVLAEPDPDHMLTPSGFWVRDGELLAMAVHRRGKPVVNGKRQKVEGKLDFTTRIYRFDPARGNWMMVGKLPDTFSDKPVERLSTGEWAMIRSTLSGARFYAVGGKTALDDWESFPIPGPADGHKMTEGHLYELADGTFTLLFRDNSRSHFIYRAFSNDRGQNWSPLVATDFPDQTAKFSVLRLSTGEYVLASNPRPAEDRFPLTVSLSDDGVIFNHAVVVVDSQPGPRYPNFTKRSGAQYPHAIEADGTVLIAYSLNQEAIQVVKIPAGRLASLK